MNIHEFVEGYQFEFGHGPVHQPTPHEKAMLEDAINAYIAASEEADQKMTETALVGLSR